MPKKCSWELDHTDLRWHSGCGYESDCPNDGTVEAHWIFCPFCGEYIEDKKA